MQTMICIRVPLRKEYDRRASWGEAVSVLLLTPVRAVAVCQHKIGRAYIQLTISNPWETGIGLAYSLRTSLL